VRACARARVRARGFYVFSSKAVFVPIRAITTAYVHFNDKRHFM